MNKVDHGRFALALSSLDSQKLPCFDSVLVCFRDLLTAETDDTRGLKKSFAKVQDLVEVWLSNTTGFLHHRILHFKKDLDDCLRLICGLPERINTFWKKQLTLLCVKIQSLFAQTDEIALCAKNPSDDLILEAFQNHVLSPEEIQELQMQKCFVCLDEENPMIVERVQSIVVPNPSVVSSNGKTALNQNPTVRALLGINEEIETEVALTEAEVVFRQMVDEDPYGSYDKVLQIQKSTPPERSADPTKKTRLLAEEQMQKTQKRLAGGLKDNI